MSQLDSRPSFNFTRLNETKLICKSDGMPAPVEFKSFRTLIDKEDLDLVAQEILGEQHRWRDIADVNVKTILEFGIDFPFTQKIGFP